MTIASELISLTTEICQQDLLPPVSWIHLPPENPRDPHHKKFGVLVLADGSCGFFFTRLGDNLKQLRDKIDEKQILNTPVLDLAEGYDNENLVKRALGLGALNAARGTGHSAFEIWYLEHGSQSLVPEHWYSVSGIC